MFFICYMHDYKTKSNYNMKLYNGVHKYINNIFIMLLQMVYCCVLVLCHQSIRRSFQLKSWPSRPCERFRYILRKYVDDKSAKGSNFSPEVNSWIPVKTSNMMDCSQTQVTKQDEYYFLLHFLFTHSSSTILGTLS
jgi:hypothetical protein